MNLVDVLVMLYWLVLLMLPAYCPWLAPTFCFCRVAGICVLGFVVAALFVVVICVVWFLVRVLIFTCAVLC